MGLRSAAPRPTCTTKKTCVRFCWSGYGEQLTKAGPVSLGQDLIHRFAKKRFELFLTAGLAMYTGDGVLLPLGLYKWVLRSPWLLAIVAVRAAQCVVQGAALRLARRGRYQQSITLACISNWATLVDFGDGLAPRELLVCSRKSQRKLAHQRANGKWIHGGSLIVLGTCPREVNCSRTPTGPALSDSVADLVVPQRRAISASRSASATSQSTMQPREIRRTRGRRRRRSAANAGCNESLTGSTTCRRRPAAGTSNNRAATRKLRGDHLSEEVAR